MPGTMSIQAGPKCRSASLTGSPVWLVLAVLVALAGIICPSAAAADVKRIMVIHSFGRDFKPWSEYGKAIRTELERQSPAPIEIFDHSLVANRSGEEDVERPFVEYLRALFAKNPLDLIISIGAPA